ncbi:MAG: bifunctional 2-octaprenyl-6-methoxy-1,4-benzoquinone methylase and S-adenosylmethionine:2-DMK methyltransferase [Arenicellales bacterium IbO2]|nr:MAG: bifunctional 2-octaprenyl-6-methoxy-1,4-benzoquinone methylase and S-adenosylmethionine:2-DMK methyltransferase [Arenicellales bacterium IbO2]
MTRRAPAAFHYSTANHRNNMSAHTDPLRQNERAFFGNREVPAADKAGMVGEVFRSVASRYDLMNDLMSFGAHRLWKRFAASQSALRRGDCALDVAGGSGDMARRLARQVGADGMVALADINAAMLEVGRDKMIDAGLCGNIAYARCDAEKLCFADGAFDCVSIAFGLRNVTRMEDALASMRRVLRPGGRLLLLEFSKPLLPLLEKIYDRYSLSVIPALGGAVAGDEAAYRYLVESIRKHPDQEAMKEMMLRVGFDEVRVHNLSGGIVALHIGWAY